MSDVLRARGNTHVLITLPDKADDEMDNTQLTAAYTSADRFPKVTTASFQSNAGQIDKTNFDSGNWAEFMMDIKTGTIPITTLLVVDETYIEDLMAAYEQSKKIGYLLVFGDVPATGAKNLCISGFARIQNLNINAQDIHRIEMTLIADGAPTFKQGATAYPKHNGTYA